MGVKFCLKMLTHLKIEFYTLVILFIKMGLQSLLEKILPMEGLSEK